MLDKRNNDSMLAMYLFDTAKQLEELEKIMIRTEEMEGYEAEEVDAIFRIMHTIKGSSAMMAFDHIAKLAHLLEDVYSGIRENHEMVFAKEILSTIVLESIDYIYTELDGLKNGIMDVERSEILIEHIKEFMGMKSHKEQVKTYFTVNIYFDESSQMEDIHAYTLVQRLGEVEKEFSYNPVELMENPESAKYIRNNGLTIGLYSGQSKEDLQIFFEKTPFLKSLYINELGENSQEKTEEKIEKKPQKSVPAQEISKKQNSNNKDNEKEEIMSIKAHRVERIMDLLGEIVIAQSMVIENPDLVNLKLDNFNKSARQLIKITSELQNEIMSIRMVTISSTFYKMKRITRDMSKKLGKKVKLEILGEETEVDKKVIEYITDPLMHMVRNAMDHGLENSNERKKRNKPEVGTITLEAMREGNEVVIFIKDDGKGLDEKHILKKAEENGLLTKSVSEYTKEEIYKLIFLPGFSTKTDVSEFSGRGVGMDVVVKNIEAIGGSISVESQYGKGSTFIIRIPLTRAIIDGMNMRVGSTKYTLPTIAIKESFRADRKSIVKENNGHEMIVIRGECYPIIKLYELYNIETNIKEVTEGIVIRVGDGEKRACLFVDEILGQQQVVMKSLPKYISNLKKISGITGCTLLGDGSISLILDHEGIIDKARVKGKVNES